MCRYHRNGFFRKYIMSFAQHPPALNNVSSVVGTWMLIVRVWCPGPNAYMYMRYDYLRTVTQSDRRNPARIGLMLRAAALLTSMRRAMRQYITSRFPVVPTTRKRTWDGKKNWLESCKRRRQAHKETNAEKPNGGADTNEPRFHPRNGSYTPASFFPQETVVPCAQVGWNYLIASEDDDTWRPYFKGEVFHSTNGRRACLINAHNAGMGFAHITMTVVKRERRRRLLTHTNNSAEWVAKQMGKGVQVADLTRYLNTDPSTNVRYARVAKDSNPWPSLFKPTCYRAGMFLCRMATQGEVDEKTTDLHFIVVDCFRDTVWDGLESDCVPFDNRSGRAMLRHLKYRACEMVWLLETKNVSR